MKRRGRDLLPRYTRPKRLKNGRTAYFFEIPKIYRDAGCTVRSEALGSDFGAACKRVNEVLLPAFDSWRTGGASDIVAERAAVGTFDWLVITYKKNGRYSSRRGKTQHQYDQGLALASGHILKNGARFGTLRLTQITQNAADRLYEALRFVCEPVLDENGDPVTGPDGEPVMRQRERRATANAAMRACRRAWNVAHRAAERIVPERNPFRRMGLVGSPKGTTPTATYEEFHAFVAKADEMGRSSLGTAAWIAWEWLPRGEDIFGTFAAEHYRPKERPNSVKIVHTKTGEEAWFPLIDTHGTPFYPELMARLDELKRLRPSGLLLLRDWPDARAGHPLPWPTESKHNSLSFMTHEVKRIILAAGLRPELSFRSFRHGGITEAADSDLTDREIQSQTRHLSVDVLPTYAKRTMKQVAKGARKRRENRLNDDVLE